MIRLYILTYYNTVIYISSVEQVLALELMKTTIIPVTIVVTNFAHLTRQC